MSLFFISSTVLGQKAQEIRGIAKENKPASYYEEQAQLWEEIHKKNPKDGNAWVQHYKAQRSYLQLTYADAWTNTPEDIYKRLIPIIEAAKNQMGANYEYYYMLGLNAKGEEAIGYLEKAYALDSDRSEIYGWLFTYYAPRFMEEKAEELACKMIDHNLYSNANLKWNYNGLMTVEKNGVFIANGDMDCIPKWVLQYAEGIRDDVLVISKWMLSTDDSYRKKIFKRIGINQADKSLNDFGNLSQYTDYLAAHLLSTSERPTYINCGTEPSFFKAHDLEDNVYLVGMAFKYAKRGFDNLSTTIQNFEQHYELEYLQHNFQKHPEDEVVQTRMNLTYLPGLMKLKKHYQQNPSGDRLAYYNQLIEKIAKESGRKDEVLSWFED